MKHLIKQKNKQARYKEIALKTIFIIAYITIGILQYNYIITKY